MNSFELNKIIGAVLGTLLFVMGVGFIAEAIYTPRVTAEQSYDLPEPVATAATTAAPAKPVVPLPVLLSQASAKAGEGVAKKCQACHDFTDGGPNKVGPNLYDVVGRPIAEHPGFAYSDALLKHKGSTWTYANLDDWLKSPKDWAPGTKMTFAGISDDKDRANLLAYLQTLAHSPVPFPEPAPAGTEGGVKAPDQQAGAAPAPGNATAAPNGAPANPDLSAPQPSTGNGPASVTTETAPTPSASEPTTEAAPAATENSAAPAAGDEAAPAASDNGAAPAANDAANDNGAAPAADASADQGGAAPAATTDTPESSATPAPETSGTSGTDAGASDAAPQSPAPETSAPASGVMAPQQIAPAPAPAGQ
jgi:cytochrome c